MCKEYFKKYTESTPETKKDPQILISGWYGNNNVGDEAILLGILQAIKEQMPNVNFLVFSDNPRHTEDTYQVDSFSQWPNGLKRRPYAVAHIRFWKHFFQLLKVIKQGDLFILGGGGLLQHGKFGVILFWLSKALLAHVLGKQVMIYGIGASPIHSRLCRILIKLVGNKTDLITVRDEESQLALLYCGVKKPPIYVTADPAITLVPNGQSIKRMRQFLEDVGIALGMKSLIGFVMLPLSSVGKAPKSASEKQTRCSSIVAEAIDLITSELKVQVLLLVDNYREDPTVVKEVYGLVKEKQSVTIVHKNMTPDEFVGIISHLDVLISMRLHPLCLAAVAHTPLVGIIGHPKVDSFLRLIEQEKRGLLLEALSPERIKVMVEQALMEQAQIKKQLKASTKVLIEKALLNAELVTKLLGRNNK